MANQPLLRDFLEQVSAALRSLAIDDAATPSEIRALLLDVQLSTLSRLVLEHNQNVSPAEQVTVEDVQQDLKLIGSNARLFDLSEKMNEEARLAYARLVLYSGLVMESSGVMKESDLKRTGELQRGDILEFCGLCQSALKLAIVKEHLENGTPMFPHIQQPKKYSSAMSAPERIGHIRDVFFHMIGYDAEFGNSEMKQLIYNLQTASANSFENDRDVINAVESLISSSKTAAMNASSLTSQPSLSDKGQGGVTQVVAVDYSEKALDPETGKEIIESHGAPIREIMSDQTDENEKNKQQREQNKLHVAVSSLEQEIRQELMGMTAAERKLKLFEAQTATREFLEKAASKPATQRIEFLQSIDPSTKRLMIMHKMWQNMS